MLHRLCRLGRRFGSLAAFALLVTGGTPAARAFDQVVHHSLVYAAAIANGLPAHEAALVANASYSLDENDSTTAFSMTLLPAEFKEAMAGLSLNTRLPAEFIDRLIELPHARSGQVFHALTTPENRRLVQQAHLRRINRVLTSPSEPGTPEQRRRRALLYFGQYLHFVGDTVVHPNDPFLGHGLDGHTPDRGDLDHASVMRALALFGREVTAFQRASATRSDMPVQWLPGNREEAASGRLLPARLGSTDAGHRLIEQVGRTVADSWQRTYPGDICGFQGALSSETVGDWLERERSARAASEVNRLIAQFVPRSEVHRLGLFHKIVLDSDGEPIAYCRRPPKGDCDPAEANAMFGRVRGIDFLPFASTLANHTNLQKDRRVAVKTFLDTLPLYKQYYVAKGGQLWATTKVGEFYASVCGVKRSVDAVEARPPARAAPAEIAQLRMASGNMMATLQQAVQEDQAATRNLAAAAREADPPRRARHEAAARRAAEARDGLLVSLAQKAEVPIAPPRQNSALEFGRSPTLELLRKMDKQYKDEGAVNPLGTFLENYDGAKRRAAVEINRNPGTQFFNLPPATRPAAGPPTIPPAAPPPVVVPPATAPGRGEPGGIKFSSARASEVAASVDISSIAFDAARGRIVVAGARGSEAFDLDLFADVLRLAVETDEPFFSLDAVDNVAWDGLGKRLFDEIDKQYPQLDQLVAAIRRVAPPPLVRGERQYYYTTVEALDPDLLARATSGQNIATGLVFSPAWLRYSKVGKVLYEADLAIKAVAAGFVEVDGGIVPVPALWKLPGYEPIWAQPSTSGAGRANFELSRARLVREQGRIDLASVHPGLYFTERAAGTDRDLPPSPRDRALSEQFDKHWKAYADAVPEIARLVTVFRAYVAARFLVENHPGLKARILAFPRELPPEQPPVLIVMPSIIRIAVERGQPVPLDGKHFVSIHGGYGGGIVFGTDKRDAAGPRIVVASKDTPPGSFWSGLFAATWYDGRTDAAATVDGRAFALDFDGGDMPLAWHLRLIVVALLLSFTIAAVSLLRRRFDWQRTEVETTCRHCSVLHRRLGAVAISADIVAAASLGYLALLPLAAAAYESNADWRSQALSAVLLPVVFVVLILLGLVIRGAFDFSRRDAPRSVGVLVAMPTGARFAAAAVALLLLHRGLDQGAIGAVVAQLLTPAVAERTFAMGGGAGVVALAAALAGGSAVFVFVCRWLAPLLLGSRPLALFSFAPASHSHGHQTS